jgi:RNA polymerase sigma factor (sigma-70 family)
MGQDEDPFNLFLSLLSPDRDTAEKKFKDIRRRLVVMLDCRGCTCSDDLADEAIFRFIRRLAAMADPFTDNPIPYLYTVAYNLYLEYIEKRFLPLPDDITEVPQPDAEENKEHLHECLDACLDKMDSKSRELVLGYYQREKQAKIDFRKSLARGMGISANALRIKLHHIRSVLGECIEECLGLKLPAETK